MFPNKTWQNYITRSGQFFDWTNREDNPAGGFYNVTEGSYYNMPISHKHKPNKNGIYTDGGPWLSYVRTVERGGDSKPIYRVGWGKAFQGRTGVDIPHNRNLLSEAQLHNMHKELWEKGSEAWAALKPAQPDFSLAVSVYELRELPKLYKRRLYNLLKEIRDEKRRIRKASRRIKKRRGRDDGVSVGKATGDMHLAVQFGWLPLISDILGFTETFNHKHKLLDQLIRDEGRPVKRKRKISSPPPSNVSQSGKYARSNAHAVHPSFVTQCYASRASGKKAYWNLEDSSEMETWAEGKFRYYLPPGPRTEGWKQEMYHRIMGGRLTPAAVYQILPWSWLADYFSDLGHFLEATSGGVEENLVAEYAYIMRTYRRNYALSVTEWVNINLAGTDGEKTSTINLKDTVKMRVYASPFGFGLKEQDLTPKQAGILGALGLSKLG